MRVSRLVCLAIVAGLTWHPILHAQTKGKGPKPEPTNQPVSAVFDTNVEALPSSCTAFGVSPGISGDGGPYAWFDSSTGTGAYLRSSDGDFELDLQDNGRFVYINFSASFGALPTTPTLPSGFCHVMLDEFHFNTHVLTQNGGDDIGLGFNDMAPGATHPARIRAFFDYVDRNGSPRTYTIRFNPVGYPGSTNVAITRGPVTDSANRNYALGADQWVIETDPYGGYAAGTGEVAQLVSPALTKKGNPGPNNEGFYTLPFKITVTLLP